MGRYFNTAIRMLFVTLILFGLVYPLVFTGIAQVLFPHQANGSLLVQRGQVLGSELLGQNFTRPEYFHPRPSAAGNGYDPLSSSGSNLGPTSKALSDRVASDVAALQKDNPGLRPGEIPVDMVTTSASGLDPDITPANAYAQAARVALSRGLSEAQVRALITQQLTDRQFGFLGEPRVNILHINLALDSQLGMPHLPVIANSK